MRLGEIQSALDRNLCLFKMITARDIFVEFYNQQLLRRLISGSEISMEVERYILGKFSEENGEEFIK